MLLPLIYQSLLVSKLFFKLGLFPLLGSEALLLLESLLFFKSLSRDLLLLLLVDFGAILECFGAFTRFSLFAGKLVQALGQQIGKSFQCVLRCLPRIAL